MDTSNARRWFDRHGVSIGAWADARGFSRTTVYAVLAGRSPALRGEAHQVAVALGLKPPETLHLNPNEDRTAYAGPAGVVVGEHDKPEERTMTR